MVDVLKYLPFLEKTPISRSADAIVMVVRENRWCLFEAVVVVVVVVVAMLINIAEEACMQRRRKKKKRKKCEKKTTSKNRLKHQSVSRPRHEHPPPLSPPSPSPLSLLPLMSRLEQGRKRGAAQGASLKLELVYIPPPGRPRWILNNFDLCACAIEWYLCAQNLSIN